MIPQLFRFLKKQYDYYPLYHPDYCPQKTDYLNKTAESDQKKNQRKETDERAG